MRTFLPLVFGAFLGSTSAFAAEAVGSIENIKGEVIVTNSAGLIRAHSLSERANKLEIGSPFYVGDTFETKAQSKVKLKFFEGPNFLVLGPETVFRIERASTKSELTQGKKSSEFELTRGNVRSEIPDSYYNTQAGEKFEIRSPNAVAGVRGTNFLMKYDDITRTSSLVTFRGHVAFRGGQTEVGVSEGNFSQYSRSQGVTTPEETQNAPREIEEAVEKTSENFAAVKYQEAIPEVRAQRSANELGEFSGLNEIPTTLGKLLPDRIPVKNDELNPMKATQHQISRLPFAHDGSPNSGTIPSALGGTPTKEMPLPSNRLQKVADPLNP